MKKDYHEPNQSLGLMLEGEPLSVALTRFQENGIACREVTSDSSWSDKSIVETYDCKIGSKKSWFFVDDESMVLGVDQNKIVRKVGINRNRINL